MRVPGFAQERIKEQAVVKRKRDYLDKYTFHRQNAVCFGRQEWEIWGG